MQTTQNVFTVLNISLETDNCPLVFATKRKAIGYVTQEMREQVAALRPLGKTTIARSAAGGVTEFVLMFEGEQLPDAPHYQIRRCPVS